jgi:PleD family two-component response regulator
MRHGGGQEKTLPPAHQPRLGYARHVTRARSRQLLVVADCLITTRQEQIASMARVDELTKVYNRRHMTTLLAEEKQRVERGGPGFCGALLDVDCTLKRSAR